MANKRGSAQPVKQRYQLTVPVEQDRIPVELAFLGAERKRLQAELDSINAMFKMLQSFCKHPTTYVDDGWGRMRTTHCETCGKFW